MTRREFSIALAGCAAVPTLVSGRSSPVVILGAIAGAHLPQTLAITTDFPEKFRQGLWELRTYRGANPALASHAASTFPSAGIRPLLSESNGRNLTYLIPFEDLTARDRAWTLVNADARWIRARTQFQSYGFGLYRAL
jgi:hypothetical protein